MNTIADNGFETLTMGCCWNWEAGCVGTVLRWTWNRRGLDDKMDLLLDLPLALTFVDKLSENFWITDWIQLYITPSTKTQFPFFYPRQDEHDNKICALLLLQSRTRDEFLFLFLFFGLFCLDLNGGEEARI